MKVQRLLERFSPLNNQLERPTPNGDDIVQWRRAALISLSNLSDNRMRHAKSGQWWEANPQRRLANNSVCYTEKPDMQAFLQEWTALYESKSGERGIFSRAAAKHHLRTNVPRRDPEHDWLVNPCVPGDTPILLDSGYQDIGDCVGKKVNVWNGLEYSAVIPFSTGINPLVRVSLSDGTYLDCTPYHPFVGVGNKRIRARDLTVGTTLEKCRMPVVVVGEEYSVDPYSQGFYAGDGTKGREVSWIYSPKYNCIPYLQGDITADGDRDRKRWKHGPMFSKEWVPINGSLAFKLKWLAGLIDSDGCVTKDDNGNGIQIGSINYGFLLRTRLMLTTMGVQAKIVKGKDAGYRDMPDGKGGTKSYYCQAAKRLLIGNADTYQLKQLGLTTHRASIHGDPPQRDARRFVTVQGVVDLEMEVETFCFTEPKNHTGTFNGIVTGQCSEILLRPQQVCNLTEVVVRPHDNLESLKQKVKLATLLGTFQATLTDFRYVRSIWRKNIEEEALLGVSLTGILDHPWLQKGPVGWLRELKETAIACNTHWAELLGINPAAAITCVKPSGTVSQLVDSASGIHPRHAPYYIRRVRTDKKDPMYTFMKDQGFHVEDDSMSPQSTAVISFPMKSPKGAVMRSDRTAPEQLALWEAYAREWCEHKPSITVYVKEHEWLEVGAKVYEKFDVISGVSFLPFDGGTYKQAPYEDITQEQYEEWLSKMPTQVEWSKLAEYESGDQTAGSQELACTAGGCDL